MCRWPSSSTNQYESRDGRKLWFDWDGDPTTYNAREQDDMLFGWAKTAAAYGSLRQPD